MQSWPRFAGWVLLLGLGQGCSSSSAGRSTDATAGANSTDATAGANSTDATAGANSTDATAGASSTEPVSRATEADGSCAPKILLNPVNGGDIPSFAAKLAEAYCQPDAKWCTALPEPQKQDFNEGDYHISAPSRGQWFAYCQALVASDPTLCEAIDRLSEPNLQESCQYFFKDMAEKNNDSPAFCLEQVGGAYQSPDDVGNCLARWIAPVYGILTPEQCFAATPMPPFTRFELDLFGCLSYPRPSTLTLGMPDQEQCLYDLAQTSGNAKVCQIIVDPYPSNPQSEPSCLAALKP